MDDKVIYSQLIITISAQKGFDTDDMFNNTDDALAELEDEFESKVRKLFEGYPVDIEFNPDPPLAFAHEAASLKTR